MVRFFLREPGCIVLVGEGLEAEKKKKIKIPLKISSKIFLESSGVVCASMRMLLNISLRIFLESSRVVCASLDFRILENIFQNIFEHIFEDIS